MSRFVKTHKTCPICKSEKSVDEFHQYFSKPRNKWRLGNYCKPCSRKDAKPRAIKNYQENKEKRKQYAKDYRKNNPEKIKKLSAYFTKKYRVELKECYVAEFASKSLKCTTKEIHENSELLKAYRNNMKLKRQIRNYGKK